MFGSEDLRGGDPSSFEAERRENLRLAEQRLFDILRQRQDVDYEVAQTAMLEFPLVWDRDVQRIVTEKADVIGLKPRERVLKRGHRVRMKRAI